MPIRRSPRRLPNQVAIEATVAAAHNRTPLFERAPDGLPATRAGMRPFGYRPTLHRCSVLGARCPVLGARWSVTERIPVDVALLSSPHDALSWTRPRVWLIV